MKTLFQKILVMNTVKLFFSILVFTLIWSISVAYVADFYHLSFSQGTATIKELLSIWYLIPFGVFVEEVLFRLIPMGLFVFLVGTISFFKNREYILLSLIAIASSVLFGYLHGNWVNIFIQGVTGFVYFLFYWKLFVQINQESDSVDVSFFRPLLLVVVLHTTFNSICIGLSLIGWYCYIYIKH